MPAVVRFAGDGFRPFSLALERFGENIERADVMFDQMADHMSLVFRDQFRSTGQRMQSRWAPLSPRYAEQKAKRYPGQPLMVATGDLRSSLTMRPFGIDEITTKRMILGTQVDYAAYHQSGGPNLPQRKLIGKLTTQDKQALSKIMHEHIMKGVEV